MKYLLLVFAVLAGMGWSAYSPPIASELIQMSNIAYYSLKEITEWSCAECKKFNVTDVVTILILAESIQQPDQGYPGIRRLPAQDQHHSRRLQGQCGSRQLDSRF